jgi:hypothetical protein
MKNVNLFKVDKTLSNVNVDESMNILGCLTINAI